jgi:hypothetical protein
MDHDVHESTEGGESQPMPSEEPSGHGSDEGQTSAEPLSQPAEAIPLVPTAPSARRRRRNTRVVAQRRRQWLQELLQHHAQQPANP